jgi:hypothetical protein
MSEIMKSDKALDADLNKATTFEDLRSLLDNAMTRSGVAERNAETGRFERRDPLTPASQTVAPAEEEQITTTQVIRGKEFEFSGTPLEVERMITNANKVAEALQAAAPAAPVTPRSARQKTQAEIERDICDKAELDLQLRRGELTTQEYVEKTDAIGEYARSRGLDLDKLAGQQFEQSWERATQEFLRDTPEGQTWRGGTKNLELIGNLITSHGLVDAVDKVAALRAMAAEMREKGLEFESDFTPEQMNEMTDKATPQEILQAWKEKQADPEAANAEFIRLHNGGSGIFNR